MPGVPSGVGGFVYQDDLYFLDGDLKRRTMNGVLTLAREVSLASLTDTERVGKVLVLPLRDSENNKDLWRTDGTAAGTFRLTAFPPDPLPARAEMPTAVGDQLFFSAFRRATGSELWMVPGEDLGLSSLALRADGRFRVQARWRKPNGESGFGTPKRLTTDTGYFYFFRTSNVELVVKILDGRNANGHFWVFYGALSNLRYTITVTDTETGAVRTYSNPQGTFASVGDTRASEGP